MQIRAIGLTSLGTNTISKRLVDGANVVRKGTNGGNEVIDKIIIEKSVDRSAKPIEEIIDKNME